MKVPPGDYRESESIVVGRRVVAWHDTPNPDVFFLVSHLTVTVLLGLFGGAYAVYARKRCQLMYDLAPRAQSPVE